MEKDVEVKACLEALSWGEGSGALPSLKTPAGQLLITSDETSGFHFFLHFFLTLHLSLPFSPCLSLLWALSEIIGPPVLNDKGPPVRVWVVKST
jgi:hypothetical protein